MPNASLDTFLDAIRKSKLCFGWRVSCDMISLEDAALARATDLERACAEMIGDG